MDGEKQKCPNCQRQLWEDDGIFEDVSRSYNTNGTWYNLWCPDCGAICKWYNRYYWPHIKEWKIPTQTVKKQIESEKIMNEQKKGLEALIEALNIFRKYGNPERPTHCEHDKLQVVIDPSTVSKEDTEILADLGFHVDREDKCFYSYRFGSA